MPSISANPLLTLLASGCYHSVASLMSATGLDKADLSRQLDEFTALGIELDFSAGEGYRIPGGLSLLDAAVVQASLSPIPASLLEDLQIHTAIDSTNAELLRLAGEGACSGTVCTAEQQTAGRGRRGRYWVSPFGRNLYVSVLWQYSAGAAALEGLSLAVGVAVARALATCNVENVQLKWPNDVLIGSAKLGGILLEMTGNAAGVCQVVVGVGINVAMPAGAAAAIDQQWTDIAGNGRRPDRSRLLAALLDELLPLLSAYESSGFAPWRDAWLELDAYADHPVVLLSGDQQQQGIARGVDESGALRLETAAGVQSIFGGEISMRPVHSV